MKYRALAVVLTMMVAVSACGSDSGGGNNGGATNNGTADAGADAQGDAAMGTDSGTDAGTQDDVATIGDVSSGSSLDHRCGDALALDWPFHDTVSTGEISTTDDSGVKTTTIDASAGGQTGASNNPFVYLDLSTGEKVDVNDYDAFKSGGWDIAFKRYIVRINSADSGPGDVSMAKVANTTFDAVTSAPTDASAWQQDVSYDDNCQPLTDPIGTLKTAINYLNADNATGSQSWYDYAGGLTPHAGDIYVIDVPSRSVTYKMQITDWQDGTFTIKWAEL